jgi:hypothetical protein
MRYCLLHYCSEPVLLDRAAADDEAWRRRREAVENELVRGGRLEMALQLFHSTTAVVARSGARPAVIDGPHDARTEQLVAIHVIHAEDLAEAVNVADRLQQAAGFGAFEIRPARGASL